MSQGHGVDPNDFANWFESIKQYIPNLPTSDTDRNNALRAEIAQRFIAQLLTDDERANLLGLPEGCRIREGAKIISPEKLKIGKYCWIGENAVLDASGGLEIGSHTSIGLSVYVWSHSSHLANPNMRNESSSPFIQREFTKIGSGTFISGPSVILPGVTIGDKVLIKPFSTVDRDVPSRSLVEGGHVWNGVFTDELITKLSSEIGK